MRGVLEVLQNACVINVSSFDLSKAMNFSRILSKVKLSPTARLVLRCLADFYNPKKGLVYPGQKTISECTGSSLRSVVKAIEELRNAGLILTSGESGEKLKYHFTNKFFELAEVAQGVRKNWIGGCAEIAHHEQINNNKLNNMEISYKNKNNGFQSYKSKGLNSPANMAGQNYVSVETTKKLIEEKNKIKKSSPMDDLDCAKQWLSSLTQNQLNHPFFKDRADKIKKIWGLKESDILSFSNNKMSLEQNL